MTAELTSERTSFRVRRLRTDEGPDYRVNKQLWFVSYSRNIRAQDGTTIHAQHVPKFYLPLPKSRSIYFEVLPLWDIHENNRSLSANSARLAASGAVLLLLAGAGATAPAAASAGVEVVAGVGAGAEEAGVEGEGAGEAESEETGGDEAGVEVVAVSAAAAPPSEVDCKTNDQINERGITRAAKHANGIAGANKRTTYRRSSGGGVGWGGACVWS